MMVDTPVGTVGGLIIDGFAFGKLNRDTGGFGEEAVVIVGDGVVALSLFDTCMMVTLAT